MGRDLASIYNELTIIKTKDLEECDRILNNGKHSGTVRMALKVYGLFHHKNN